MSEKQKAPQTADNPNGDGAVQADKFDLKDGDIEWIKPPKRVNAAPESATPKRLSLAQARDLGSRIKQKMKRMG
jgi:hypothetical protein